MSSFPTVKKIIGENRQNSCQSNFEVFPWVLSTKDVSCNLLPTSSVGCYILKEEKPSTSCLSHVYHVCVFTSQVCVGTVWILKYCYYDSDEIIS